MRVQLVVGKNAIFCLVKHLSFASFFFGM